MPCLVYNADNNIWRAGNARTERIATRDTGLINYQYSEPCSRKRYDHKSLHIIVFFVGNINLYEYNILHICLGCTNMKTYYQPVWHTPVNQ